MADITDGGLWLQSEVTRYSDTWYRTIYPERWGANGEHHQAIGDLRLGEKRIVVPRIEAAGRASIHTGRAIDVPLLKLGATADEWHTRVVIMRAEWDWIADIAAEEVANSSGILPRRNIVQELMNGLKEKIVERIHELVVFGDAIENMAGLLNSDLVEQVDIPVGTNIHQPSAAGADLGMEAYLRMKRYLKYFHKKSMLTSSATLLLCTMDWYDVLLTPFQNYNETPLDRLIGNNPQYARYLNRIVPVNELQADLLERFGVFRAGDNRERFVIMEEMPTSRDVNGILIPSILRNFYPLDYTIPRMITDTGYSMTAFEATSEMQIRHPFKILYVNYDKYVET